MKVYTCEHERGKCAREYASVCVDVMFVCVGMSVHASNNFFNIFKFCIKEATKEKTQKNCEIQYIINIKCEDQVTVASRHCKHHIVNISPTLTTPLTQPPLSLCLSLQSPNLELARQRSTHYKYNTHRHAYHRHVLNAHHFLLARF